MSTTWLLALLIYLAAVSFVTFAVTVYDKSAAAAGRRRVPEAALFSLAIFGGAVAEYATMKLIRHKTLHKSFMIGLPLIILAHAAVIAAALYFTGALSVIAGIFNA